MNKREEHQKAKAKAKAKARAPQVKTGIKAGPMVDSGGPLFDVDEDGFLADPSTWTSDIADGLA